jgi:hypothetical protein
MAGIIAGASGSRTRVIDGCLYARTDTPYAYQVKVHDLGHGQVEALALPVYGWHEVDALSDGAMADYAACLADPPPPTERELLDRAAANRERATKRARTKVRRLAKAKGLATLLTLTYRENMTDRERMKRDFDVFMKRLRRAVPDVEYICVFERQKRGAWHAHIAVRRVLPFYVRKGVMVKSYDLLRSMWRGVVGADNGNVDVSRNRRVQRSAAKLAVYLSKYIGKDLGADLAKWENSYSASGRALPDAISEKLLGATALDALNALANMLGQELSAGCEFYQALLEGGGVYWCLSPPERKCDG